MTDWPPLDASLAARVHDLVTSALAMDRSVAVAMEVTRQTLVWADQLIETFETVSPLPRPLACQPGCTPCCHNPLEATPPEILFVGQMLVLYLAPARLAKIRERVLLAAALRAGQTKEDLAASRRARPCPLLEGDRCAVYPWRPLMCRAMHSLDREHCQRSLAANDFAAGEYYLHRYLFPCSLAAGLREGFQALGCQAAPLELTQALREALLQPRLAERWLQGEQVFDQTFG